MNDVERPCVLGFIRETEGTAGEVRNADEGQVQVIAECVEVLN